jgi:hemerythrin-like metal-binding protein
LISQNTLYDLADPSKYDIRFVDRIRVKGKTQPLSLYEVFDNDPPGLRAGKRASRPKFEQALACYHLKKIPRAIELLQECIEIAPTDIPAHIYMARCDDYLATGQHIGTGELDTSMEWRPEFQLGLKEIDKPHRHLFNTVNAFLSSPNKADRAVMGDLFAFLANHTGTHFQTEENLMRRYNYPFIESHLQEHRRFIENFTALQKESCADESDLLYLSFRIQFLLLDWFTGHLAKTDRHMGRYLLNAMLSQSHPSV